MKYIKNIALILATTLTFSTSFLWAQNDTPYNDENSTSIQTAKTVLNNQNETQYSDENNNVSNIKYLRLDIENLDQQIKKEYEKYGKLKNSSTDEAKKCELKMYQLFVELSKLEEELEKLEKTQKSL